MSDKEGQQDLATVQTHVSNEQEAAVPASSLHWDGKDDPECPYNWPLWKKWLNTMTVAGLCLVVTLGSSLYVSSELELTHEFGVSREVFLVGLTLYLIGLCWGPVLSAPISETQGRYMVYVLSFPIAILFSMGVGLSKNIGSVLVCRFFSGLFGSPAMAVAGGTIMDLWGEKMLGIAMTVFCLAPFMGPVLGPIIGNFAAEHKGWKWTSWVHLMFCGAVLILLMFCRETYSPILLKKRAKKRGIAYYETTPKGKEALRLMLVVTLARPMRMLFTEPVVMFLSIYCAFIFAILYTFFEAYPIIFTLVYQMDQGVSGLPFLGIGTGLLAGGLLYIFMDLQRLKRATVHPTTGAHVAPPLTTLLLPTKIGAVLLPVSLFWIGWSAKRSVHWIAPTLAGVFFGIPLIFIFLSSVHYLSATYPPLYAASTIAANNFLRYTVAAVFPLFTIQMFEKMHISWACSFFGFVAVALMPIPWVFEYFEDYIQTHSKFSTRALALKKIAEENEAATEEA